MRDGGLKFLQVNLCDAHYAVAGARRAKLQEQYQAETTIIRQDYANDIEVEVDSLCWNLESEVSRQTDKHDRG